MSRLPTEPSISTRISPEERLAKDLLTQKLLTQTVIERWDNEGGAGPDGPQEGAHAAPTASVQSPAPKVPASINTQRWSQNLSGGAHVLIRPINKLDARAERRFIEGLSNNAQRLRFMAQIPHPTEKFIAQLTDLDGVTEVALVALIREGTEEKIVGVSRYSLDVSQNRCECALAVSDDWQHRGLGTALMQHLIQIARANQIAMIESVEYAENLAMRSLLHELGFHMRADPSDARLAIYTLQIRPTSER